jgi:hypothetical protein
MRPSRCPVFHIFLRLITAAFLALRIGCAGRGAIDYARPIRSRKLCCWNIQWRLLRQWRLWRLQWRQGLRQYQQLPLRLRKNKAGLSRWRRKHLSIGKCRQQNKEQCFIHACFQMITHHGTNSSPIFASYRRKQSGRRGYLHQCPPSSPIYLGSGET